MIRLLLLSALVFLSNCDPEAEMCPIAGDPVVHLGVPDSISFLDFEALEEGAMIPVSSTGQTDLSVQLAIRVENFGPLATVDLRVTLDDGSAMAESSTFEPMRCRTDGFRYLIPIAVTSADLGPDRELRNRTVDVHVRVTDEEGHSAEADARGVLRRL